MTDRMADRMMERMMMYTSCHGAAGSEPLAVCNRAACIVSLIETDGGRRRFLIRQHGVGIPRLTDILEIRHGKITGQITGNAGEI